MVFTDGRSRPDWPASDTPHYDAVADAFYAEQHRLFEASGMWAVDLLHEGGKSGGVPPDEAARGVEAGMRRADPAYTWVLQAWVGNPRRELLDAVDRERLLPSLRANQASAVGPRALGYPAGALVPALRLMLSGAPGELTPGFRFDLVDLARQVVDDEARRILPALAEAADAKDLDRYDRLVALFLDGVDGQDAVLSTDENFLLGHWVADVRRWAGSPAESVRLATEAKRLLTSWGYEDSFVLTEYATRSWAGLVGGYFRSRWERWFAEVRKALTAEPTTAVDWYRFTADWVEPDVEFAAVPSGAPSPRRLAALRQARSTRSETG
ncbi:alpha-N-acetylglucosaminidase C-terminal domain-containing protein [Nonomuraea antimicrobica]